MREYETTFIARAEMSDDTVRQFADRIKSVIERHNGTVLDSQTLGRQNLAYPIEKQTKGTYVFLDYTGDTAVVAEIERTLRLDESILKYLTVKTGDDVNAATRQEEIQLRKEKLAAAIAAAAAPAPLTEEATEEITEAAEEVIHA